MTAPVFSPKRKRDAEALTSQAHPSTCPATFVGVALQDGDSPRTAVARDLEQLKLQGKGRGSIDLQPAVRNGREIGASLADDMLDVGGKARKRVKRRSAVAEAAGDAVAMTLRPKSSKSSGRHGTADSFSISLGDGSSSNDTHTPDAGFGNSSPNFSASRTKTRLRSPPLSSNKNSDKKPQGIGAEDAEDEDDEVLRSRLTWRDDEITGVDFDDPDDDGEGVNGIGYKPTAAQAQARIEKRKQQIMEYRSREANEARKRRIERRGRLATPVREDGETKTIRKVRFADHY